jgi:exopolysaccharide biosynthesis polyprenyl glycosylphosphotransferase
MVNVAYVGIAALGLVCLGTYHLRCTLSILDEAPRIAATLGVAALVCAPFGGAHEAVLTQAALSVPLLLAGRAIAHAVVRAWRRRGLREPTVIAGSGHVGIELATVITSHPEFGLDLVGFAGSPFPDLPAPLLGDIGQLGHVVTENHVRRVVVAFGPTREADLVSVLRTAMLRAVQVHIVPRFFEVGVAPRGSDVDDLWGIPVYRVRQAALQRWAWRFKRCVDILISSVLLVLALPLLAIAAVIVKLSSPGPILFRQRRIGQYGDEIEVLKFRTLPVEHVDDVWNADAEQYHSACWFLRRLSIDELPQLWNVLRGDMSLVGPRPERGYLVEQFNDEVYGYRDRHRLPVGLTGWAQVHGLRGETSLRERVRFDNHYIEHWSLWRDLVILFRTVLAVFQRPARGSRPDSQLPTHTQFGVAATPSPTDDAAATDDATVDPVRSTVI